MTWLWLALGGTVLIGGALAPVLLRREAHPGGAEISARSAYLLLGDHVETPPAVPDSDEGTTALLREATERWHSAGAALATATTREDFRLAERIAGEGLDAVAKANGRLGLPAPPTRPGASGVSDGREPS